MSLFPPKKAASFDFKEVGYEKGEWVARITIKRPHNYNAYSTPTRAIVPAANELRMGNNRSAFSTRKCNDSDLAECLAMMAKQSQVTGNKTSMAPPSVMPVLATFSIVQLA